MKKLVAYSSVSHLGFVVLGHLRAQRERRAGRGLPDARARHLDRRALPHRRHAVRSAAHARDRGVRRPQGGHAEAGRGVPADHAGVGRAAGHERLRRRVPDPARRVRAASSTHASAVHGGRGDRRDSLGRLHALDVPARELRAGDQREEPRPARSQRARVVRDRAGLRDVHRHGRRARASSSSRWSRPCARRSSTSGRRRRRR